MSVSVTIDHILRKYALKAQVSQIKTEPIVGLLENLASYYRSVQHFTNDILLDLILTVIQSEVTSRSP